MKDRIKRYQTKEVAKRLTIEPVTLRKYVSMLEKQGYVFHKDDRGWRVFVEEDIKALEYLQMLKSQGHSLEKAVERVAELYKSNLVVAQPDTTLQSSDLKEFIKQQTEFNETLMKRMEDRDKKLMMILRQLQETKAELAVTKKKHWWNSLF